MRCVLALVTVALLPLAALGAAADATPGGAATARSAATTAMADLRSGHFAQVCAIAVPTEASTCRSDLAELAAVHATYSNLSLGVITVEGTRALFVLTGRVCATGVHPACLSNNDANTATDHAKTFNQVYRAAVGASSSSPFIVPLVDHDGRWYVAGF